MTHKRNGSTRYLIFLFSLAIFLFTACDPDDSLNSAFGEPAKGPSPDRRFRGGWTTTSYGRYSPYLNEFEWYRYESKEFNSTNVYWEYISYDKWGIKQANYPLTFNKEWKITGNQFCERLWNNPYSTWRCKAFEFLDSSRVRIGSDVFEKE